MFKNKAFIASLVGLFGNILLFTGKLTIGLMTNSLAVISDAVNSFTDIFASSAISWSVHISDKKADEDHPFGHYRAQPIAAFLVSIFMAIAAFEISKDGIMRFFVKQEVLFSYLSVGILLLAILIKTVMFFYLRRSARMHSSCALEATAIDCRNDVLTTSVALFGVLGVYFGYVILDSVAAVLIGFFIAYSAYKVGAENIDYLMGRAPSQEVLNALKKLALNVAEVKNVHDILAHFVGTFLHVEIHIEVDKRMCTRRSHDIGKEVQKALLKHELVKEVFVHVDPV